MHKCDKCTKKVLITFTCKCDKKFCLNDKAPEDHACKHIYTLFKLPQGTSSVKIPVI